MKTELRLTWTLCGLVLAAPHCFATNIPDLFLHNGRNSLVVRVDNRRLKEGVPTLNTDWWNYGGLTRSVQLVRTPAAFIADHQLWLESEDTKTIAGWVEVAGAGEGEQVEVGIPDLGLKQTAVPSSSGRLPMKPR
jgi:beta-glucuronidase